MPFESAMKRMFSFEKHGRKTQPWPASVRAVQHVCIPRSARPARVVVQQCTAPGPLVAPPSPSPSQSHTHTGPVCPVRLLTEGTCLPVQKQNYAAPWETHTDQHSQDSSGGARTGTTHYTRHIHSATTQEMGNLQHGCSLHLPPCKGILSMTECIAAYKRLFPSESFPPSPALNLPKDSGN